MTDSIDRPVQGKVLGGPRPARVPAQGLDSAGGDVPAEVVHQEQRRLRKDTSVDLSALLSSETAGGPLDLEGLLSPVSLVSNHSTVNHSTVNHSAVNHSAVNHSTGSVPVTAPQADPIAGISALSTGEQSALRAFVTRVSAGDISPGDLALACNVLVSVLRGEVIPATISECLTCAVRGGQPKQVQGQRAMHAKVALIATLLTGLMPGADPDDVKEVGEALRASAGRTVEHERSLASDALNALRALRGQCTGFLRSILDAILGPEEVVAGPALPARKEREASWDDGSRRIEVLATVGEPTHVYRHEAMSGSSGPDEIDFDAEERAAKVTEDAQKEKRSKKERRETENALYAELRVLENALRANRDPDTIAGELVPPEDAKVLRQIDRLKADIAALRGKHVHHS